MFSDKEIPQGFRRIKVGEVFPKHDDVRIFRSYGRPFSKTAHDWEGCVADEDDILNFVFRGEPPAKKKKVARRPWKTPADEVFNSIFPVEEMEREDSMGYLAALIEAKYTESEFRKACEKMAKGRKDAIND